MSHDIDWLRTEAHHTLNRLLPRLTTVLDRVEVNDVAIYLQRLRGEFPRLFTLLHQLYGERYDFIYHVERVLQTATEAYANRSDSLKLLDRQREKNPLWFQDERMIGAVAYVDLFADNLQGLMDRIPYLQELGITYLHLMPLFQSPPDRSDGGYAISDYRQVNPRLGKMAELAKVAKHLRVQGISLTLDFVFNHTSDQHPWALYAKAGKKKFQDYYYTFPDRTMPDQYEATLREIFPEQAPGNFTYNQRMDRWVWTSFYQFQWDLNYSNPAVFNAMLRELLFLANQGVEILRLDAVAFIWKQLGTGSENLPQAHWIIQAYNAVTHIACPAMVFKSEAIVHPDDVLSYVSWEECPISYNPTLMALLWEALATRNVRLLQHSMAKRFALPEKAAWVNYIRVHDDIGWTFADEDAAEIGINGYDHRRFLNAFYTGTFEGSFAMGIPFGYNARTGDMRISGTMASLIGLEQGLLKDDDMLIDMAKRRIQLVYAVIIAAGGIPLLYLGDEIATLNDYSYQQNPNKYDDSRWVHRAKFDWRRATKRNDASTVVGFVYQGIRRLIKIRKSQPQLGKGTTTFFPTQNDQVLGFVRNREMMMLGNFTEQNQQVETAVVKAYFEFDDELYDLIAQRRIPIGDNIHLGPYEFMWWIRSNNS